MSELSLTFVSSPQQAYQFSSLSSASAKAALESNGTLTRADAIALGSSNLEVLLGVEYQHDLVAYHGGDVFDLSSRPIAVLSPRRGFVDLFYIEG